MSSFQVEFYEFIDQWTNIPANFYDYCSADDNAIRWRVHHPQPKE